MRYIILIAFSLSLFSFSSCKHDEVTVIENSDAYRILTSYEWQIASSTYSDPIDKGSGPTTDALQDLKDCRKDDIHIFELDSQYRRKYGAEKCFLETGEYHPWIYNWYLTNNNSTIVRISPFGDEGRTEIIAIKDREYTIQATFTEAGKTITVTTTYKGF